ncbi:MAG: YncE family protein [Planctomycetes bacterium]|nr:YncE family protein [Planctomycetota bacterium]
MRSSATWYGLFLKGFGYCALFFAGSIMGCSGGGSGNAFDDAGGVAGVFNSRHSNLYSETPAIEVTGNNAARQAPDGTWRFNRRNFNPQTSRTAELYDSDGDGSVDTKINDFESIVNAANRLLDQNLAACIIKTIKDPSEIYYGVKLKHLGYTQTDAAWADSWTQVSGTGKYTYQYPDTMPDTAVENGGASRTTRGTQFIQLTLPFEIKRSIMFLKENVTIEKYDGTEVNLIGSTKRQQLNFINPFFITFANEDWDDSLPDLSEFELLTSSLVAQGKSSDYIVGKQDEWITAWKTDLDELIAAHVPCTILVDGVDRMGFGPKSNKDDDLDHDYTTNLDQLKGVEFEPGPVKSTITFIAQAADGSFGIPAWQAFTLWGADKQEIRIRLIKAVDVYNNMIQVQSKWCVMNFMSALENPLPIEVLDIEATDYVLDNLGNKILDWDDPTATTPPDDATGDPGDPKTTPLVQRTTDFLIHFNKPVIPETVGQSIVFKGSPFNGNTQPVTSSLTLHPPEPGQNPCAEYGTFIDPVAPNVAIISTLYLEDGAASNVQGIIPFRVHPLHQNNLCTYVLHPLIDLPGSVNLGSPPLGAVNGLGANQNEFTRMRVQLKVYLHDENNLTGVPTPKAINPSYPDPTANPPELRLYDYPPLNMGITGYFGYHGEGELMSHGYTQSFTVISGGRYVNAPVSPHALYYSMGPSGLGVVDLDGNGFTTNDPSFSKEALVTSQYYYTRWGNAGKGIFNNYSYGAKATGGQPYIGLGKETPIPGVNEGSTGIDEIVKDSNGSGVLFPDTSPGNNKFFNIADVEIGDFLDTVYYDKGNEWALTSFHSSAVNTGTFNNNLISTPPTPNPPPLTLPIGMRPTDVILDDFDIIEEGAFVILGKEVFTVDLVGLGVFEPVDPTTIVSAFTPHTGFVHLNPAEIAGSPTDEPFPPNRSTWISGTPDYMNLGPVADSSTIGMGYFYGSRQQIGNFLFVADKSNNAVRVVNSNTMDVITSLTGLNNPDSVAVTPDLKTLYVSNSGAQSVTVYNVNPRSEEFLDKIATLLVGNQPKGICCQPDGEDVLVCNFGSNTISIINPTTVSVRKTVSSLLNGPWDLVAGPRQNTIGFGTQVYHAYITNHKADNVLIFESGPSGFGGVGYDDILDPVPKVGQSGEQFLLMHEPRGICWDPSAGLQYPLSGGCYVAHSSGGFGVVSRIEFTAQQANYGPIFLIPNSGAIGGTPGFGKRVFVITAQWGGPNNPLSGQVATDVALLDYNRSAWLNDNWLGSFYNVTNIGDYPGPNPQLPINNKSPIRTLSAGSTSFSQTFNPDRLYVSFQNTPVIDVVNPTSSQIVKTITGLPAPAKRLKTFFKF